MSGVGRKWKRSDSSDSDSVALMTPLTTPIFDFHQVKRSYDSAYDSVASENQPLKDYPRNSGGAIPNTDSSS